MNTKPITRICMVLACLAFRVSAQEPITQWAFPYGRNVEATAHLGVVAYHQGGVSSVVFSVDSSPVATVTNETLNPETGEMEFVLELDTTSYTEDSQLTIDAVVHAVPGGAPSKALPSRPVWVDNVQAHTVFYVDVLGSDTSGTGASNAPYATIGKALAMASGGDEIRVRDGDYHLGAGTNHGFTRYVHIHPDDGASPAITSADTYREDFLHIEGFGFNWTGVAANRPDGGYQGKIIDAYGAQAWFEDCTFHGISNSYNFQLSSVDTRSSGANLTVEHCRFHDILRAVVAVAPGALLRGNDIGPITSDAFDFFSEILITGNEVHDIYLPHVYIETTNAQPFNLVGAGGLTFHYDEFNTETYVTIPFADLSAIVSNPSTATATAVAEALMANAAFSNKFEAADESGKLRVTVRRTNYYQSLYVTGSANAVLGFPNEGQANEAWGSGMHSDVFQTWGGPNSNVVFRNNRAYDNDAQTILTQSDLSNFAVVNNSIMAPAPSPWMIKIDPYTLDNLMFVNNTFWGTRNVLTFPSSGYTDILFANNINGPRGVSGDDNDAELSMDYNLYDYNNPAVGEGPAANSLWSNPSQTDPTTTALFDQMTSYYDAETGYWEYSAPTGMLSLASNSVARNVGTDACGIHYDIDWNPRDAWPDMGAFEYIPATLEAYMLVDPDLGAAPLVVQFDGGTSIGPDPVTGYAWDFGDGTGSDQVAPVHSYLRRGSYNVVLQVFDAAGRTGTVARAVQVRPYSGENLVLGLSCDGDILDHSTNRHSAVWEGTAAYGAGQVNEGLDLSGGSSGNYVEVSHGDALDGMDKFSFLCWFRKDNMSVGGDLVHKHGIYKLAATAYQVEGYLYTTGTSLSSFSVTDYDIIDTDGHHVAMVYDGSEMRIYVDGEDIGGSSVPSGSLQVDAAKNVLVGKDPGGGDAFAGAIDEVFMYADALPLREIKGRAFPDSYEGYAIRYFTRAELDSSISDPDQDPDGDGILNEVERLADTDPMDADSQLAFTGISSLGSDIVLEWKGGIDATQVVYGTTNLVVGGWYALLTNQPPTLINTTATLPATGSACEFFQLEATR